MNGTAASLLLNFDLHHGHPCDGCGAAIDSSLLRSLLDNVLREVERGAWLLERVRMQFHLRRLCHQCVEQTPPPLPYAELFKQRQSELIKYFGETPACVEDNPNLREPQIESYRAIKKYFEAVKEQDNQVLPAIVEIPTGCGKTGIICAAPFGIARGRVLIIAPNLVIKQSVVKSVAGEVDALKNFYFKCGILSRPEDLPRVVSLERGQTNREDCLRADVVVTNIQQMPGWLAQFEPDFFDMIIVDEAHHEPADSWQRVNEHFARAKKVYLTATPYRCDQKPIVGHTIYRYRMKDAIQSRYIKNVMKLDAVATQMTFTMWDETRELSYDEIMSMREEAWFSKGVALSPLCNATIVDRCILIWQEKCKSGVPHQMIGAACSIRHAEQIVELFRERGVRAIHVASDGMTYDERLQRIKAYERNEYDCIVHVGILGEGYDHPNISVAGIFRPYRSLSPYAQFVGRTIRWIHGASDSDNLAHVVSHAGLNLGYLWEFYKHETREAAIAAYIDQLFWNEEPEDDDLVEAEEELDFENEQLQAEVTNEIIEGFDVDSFLPVAIADDLQQQTRRVETFKATIKGKSFRDYGRRQERLSRAKKLGGKSGSQSTLHARRAPVEAESSLTLPFNRPNVERKQHRLWLHKDVQRAAGFVMWMLKMDEAHSHLQFIGAELERAPRTNYEAVVSVLQREVNRAMGKDEHSSNRNDWTLEELRQARWKVREARQHLIRNIKQRVQDSMQQKLPFD
jgi:superfamily II DNA or RNA helicase